MKKSALLIAIALGLAFPDLSHGKPFKHQPHIANALEALDEAAKQVKMSDENSSKHIAIASKHLAYAKSELETAKKNKGSARPSAIQLIESAQTELEAKPFTADHKSTASTDIENARKECVTAGKNGSPH